MAKDIVDRLFEKAMIQESGCWKFSGYRDENGYGHIRYNGEVWLVHRVAFILCVDDIPEGLDILHSCDNPSCVNPEHLFSGTHQDNMDDMWFKGRGPNMNGTNNGSAKLTEDEVREIKNQLSTRRVSLKDIADQYNVSKTTIGRISRGENWRHV